MTISFLRIALLLLCLIPVPAGAAVDEQTAKQLTSEDSDDRITAIGRLAAAADEPSLRVLTALSEDALYAAGGRLVIVDGERVLDAASGQPIEPAPAKREPITPNNRVRRELHSALAGLKLFSPDRERRLRSAKELEGEADVRFLPILASALAKETDAEIKAVLVLAHAQASLKSEDPAVRLAAVRALGSSGNPNTRVLLAALIEKKGGTYAEPDARIRREARASLKSVERRLALAENVGRVFSGLSLGSILLLAALGLAITYGVMGVINMAHGELLMIGAYSTYLVQSLFRSHFPGAVDAYVLAAIPVSFFAAALAGVAMERLVIRHLYGRPLETLLATWGLSLIMIQAARTVFGAQNVELANPSWMSGGVEVMSDIVLPWNRIVIVGFAALVLMLVWALMNRTRLGMFVRAVTQNRAMASCVGVPTGRVDTMAFGLGAGIAGLGGCALSQIANVGPDMGQGYIVDSFLVVVLGGVGQLAGAVWAALGLGVVSKFLEGWSGAVIAKILVLVFIIVFIQKRPQGLFALKGRFVES
jgi:urea transport system permease protein